MEKMCTSDESGARRTGSFCIPRAALNALLDAKASAYEICTYLVLARFTEATGRFSSAGLSAVNRYTGANKTKGGPVDRAIDRLKTIRATVKHQISDGLSGNRDQMVDQLTDLGPILFDRDTWQAQKEQPLPDGPSERAKISHVLPDFGELVEDRIWFGGNLVEGIGRFVLPLKTLKNAGDVAARLLLLLYSDNDMEIWGGVRPTTGSSDGGPWILYEPLADVSLRGGVRLIRAKRDGALSAQPVFSRAWPPSGPGRWSAQHAEAGEPVFVALRALEASGLIYEVVLVLNRNADKRQSSSGARYGGIPDDAEPLYELDCRSLHGYKPLGEAGVGCATASAASALGHSVGREGGALDGTYAAFVVAGHPAMIAGIYRLRFRVANPKNAGVSSAWSRIHQNNRDALELVRKVCLANGVPALDSADGNPPD